VIGLHQQGMNGFSDEMIGQTTIDLEDRFYSKCYASCGLPKIYTESGVNRWRDSRSPTQILQILCKQNHMPMPVYRLEAANVLCVYIENPSLRNLSGRSAEVFMYSIKEEVGDEEYADSEISSSFISGCSERRRRLTKEKLSLLVLNNWKSITRVSETKNCLSEKINLSGM